MKRRQSVPIVLALALAFVGLWSLGRLDADDDGDSKTIDGFLAQIEQDSNLDPGAKDQIKGVVAQLRGDADARADAISEGLMIRYADYREALAAAEHDNERGVTVLGPFIKSSDRYLAADASFHLARMLVNAERFEDAIPLLESVAGPQSAYTLHRGSAAYFIGVSHAQLLENQPAIEALSKFLQSFPNAPERLRVAAWRQIQELAAIEEGQLADAHQRMDYSRRKLDLEDSGASTQQQQEKIVSILAKLIQEQEKRECSSCNSKKNTQGENNGQAKKSGQKNSDSQAAKNQQGGSSNNPNGVAERSFSDGPASPWSKLRDRSRDPAYSAIKDQLPSKYRDIVERYTEKAQSGQRPSGGSE